MFPTVVSSEYEVQLCSSRGRAPDADHQRGDGALSTEGRCYLGGGWRRGVARVCVLCVGVCVWVGGWGA